MSFRALNTLRLSTTRPVHSPLSHLYLDVQRSIQQAALLSHPPSTYPEPPVSQTHDSQYVRRIHHTRIVSYRWPLCTAAGVEEDTC